MKIFDFTVSLKCQDLQFQEKVVQTNIQNLDTKTEVKAATTILLTKKKFFMAKKFNRGNELESL